MDITGRGRSDIDRGQGQDRDNRKISQNAIVEYLQAPHYYLFNTNIVNQDTSLFNVSTDSADSVNQNGRGSVFFRTLNTTSGEIRVVIKQYQRGGMVRHFNKALYWHRHYSHSRVWREFRLLDKMTAMGLPVPLPVAGRVTRKPAGWYESFIITREIDRSVTLADILRDTRRSDADNAELWINTGQVIRHFHDAGIYHADLNASNILVTDNNDIYLIDFDKGRVESDQSSGWKQNSLDRLQRSLLKYRRTDPKFTYTDKNWALLLSGYRKT